MRCEYCLPKYQNPFKYNYMPLWFAWRPVITDTGIVVGKKVHVRTEAGSTGNLVGSFPVVWKQYYKHKSEDTNQ